MAYLLIRYVHRMLLLGVLMTVIPHCLHTQQDIQFKSIRQNDGLSNNFVHCFAQDHQGFMWIGTESGLNRYDGHHFLEFRFDPEDPQTLNHNWITTILEDSQNNLWVGTLGGLNCLNRETGKFERIPILNEAGQAVAARVHLQGIYEDRNQQLWLLAVGGTLYRIVRDTENETARAVLFDYENSSPLSTQDATIDAILFEKNGNLWLTSKRGIARLHTKSRKISHFLYPDSINLQEDIQGGSLTIWDDQDQIIGTRGPGLFFLQLTEENPQLRPLEQYFRGSLDQPLPTGTIHNIGLNTPDLLIVDIEEKNRRQLIQIDLKTGASTPLHSDINLNTFSVSSFYTDRQGNLWVATHGDGIRIGTRSRKAFTFYRHDPKDSNSISPGPVRTFIADHNGDIWTGILGSGLDQFAIEKNKKLRKKQSIKKQAKQKNGLLDDEIIKLEKDAVGNLWLATNNGGVIKMDPVTGQSQSYANNTERTFSSILTENRIWGLEVAPSGKVWIGAWASGLSQLDPLNGQLTSFKLSGEQLSFCSSRIRDLHLDKNGTLWIGTREGLCSMNTRTESFTNYQHDPNDPTSLSNDLVWVSYVDRHNDLWVGTNIGLNKFDPATQQFERFYERDGLPSHSIYGLVEDYQGVLWVSTDNGLARMLPNEGQIRFQSFGLEDGLESVAFLPKACFRYDPSGQLFFGTTRGMLVVEPDLSQTDKHSNKLVLQAISTFNFRARDGKPKIDYFIRDIEKELVLTHLDQMVDFTLSDLSWEIDANKKYEYQLMGFNQQWMEVGSDMKMSFSNLTPGKYTLIARSKSIDNVNSDSVRLLAIRVLPPWWKSVWAYTLYIFLAGGLIYALYRFQLNRQLEKQETQNLRTLNEFKNKLYTNITHEFKTPLTVISGMADQLKGQEKIKNLIKDNSANLLNLVNQILDLRRMEMGKLKLELTQGDIVLYLRYIIDSYQALAEIKGVQVHFIPKERELLMDFDQDKLLRIISNLLSNAIKFTPKGGNIYLELTKSILQEREGQALEAVQISVTDTGLGIAEEKQKFIFNRFYQIDNDATAGQDTQEKYQDRGLIGGTGIGLALTKELVTLMDGQIELKSRLGEGTTLMVRLPINREALMVEAKSFTSTRLGQDALPLVKPVSTDEQYKNDTPSQQPSLLIVEDSPDVMEYLVSLLETSYELHLAADGQAGIDLALKHIPDLIISDVMMPIKDGFELCSTLKQDERTSHIPIVLLTAKASIESRIQGLERGADAYLAKPFNQDELFVRLKKLTELRTQLRQRYQGFAPDWASLPEDASFVQEDAFIAKLKGAVEANLEDPEFGIIQLCKAIGMSRSQLHLKIKALTNRSTSNFIRTIRLYKARELLETCDYNVTQAAYDVGFTNPSYFSRTFTEEFGVSPKKFISGNGLEGKNAG